MTGLGYIRRQAHKLPRSRVIIADVERGVLSVEASAIFKKSTEKIVVIGEQRTEILPTGEKVQVRGKRLAKA